METVPFLTMEELLAISLEQCEMSVNLEKHLAHERIGIKTLHDILVTLTFDKVDLRARRLHPGVLTKGDIAELEEFEDLFLTPYGLYIGMSEQEVRQMKYLVDGRV